MNERDRKILLKILQYIDEIQFTIKELNLDLLWETATGDVIALKNYCKKILQEL